MLNTAEFPRDHIVCTWTGTFISSDRGWYKRVAYDQWNVASYVRPIAKSRTNTSSVFKGLIQQSSIQPRSGRFKIYRCAFVCNISTHEQHSCHRLPSSNPVDMWTRTNWNVVISNYNVWETSPVGICYIVDRLIQYLEDFNNHSSVVECVNWSSLAVFRLQDLSFRSRQIIAHDLQLNCVLHLYFNLSSTVTAKCYVGLSITIFLM